MTATCGDCGSPMRETFIILTMADGCHRIPNGLRCTDDACEARHLEQDRADRAARDEAALARAIAQGTINP